MSYLESGCTSFTAQDYKIAVSNLVNSKSGFYSFKDLYVELGKGDNDVGKLKIAGLIRENVLHYRPESDFARDLIPFPDYDVVTATGTPALRAMELIVGPK